MLSLLEFPLHNSSRLKNPFFKVTDYYLFESGYLISHVTFFYPVELFNSNWRNSTRIFWWNREKPGSSLNKSGM